MDYDQLTCSADRRLDMHYYDTYATHSRPTVEKEKTSPIADSLPVTSQTTDIFTVIISLDYRLLRKVVRLV